MHAKDRMTFLQTETTLAVLGDDRRYPLWAMRSIFYSFTLNSLFAE
ncbi:hypothetical protein CA13_00690 [Planctomycetes bacterium CA13]|uniref:Uncharacterized protein n=1 Tax=Novipirellula herctigrandis TaxID=2527986 RepID=A0A5C5YVL0_9BACT|nr:hypothetical protein CA13_00690 [Planctomycetes bacterium CA13]